MNRNHYRRLKVPARWEWIAFSVLSLYLVWTTYPLLWVLGSSFKQDRDIFERPFHLPWNPGDFHTSNYLRVWIEEGFAVYFTSSLLVTGGALLLILSLGSISAYGLSRFTHRLSPTCFWLFLGGLMLPAQLSMIPLFFQFQSWGILNTRLALILTYAATGLPFAIFILTGFFRTLPKALYEAALLDGCGKFQAFLHVMLPLARPGLLTVAIFQFIFIWKEYFFAFMFLSGADGEAVATLPLGLARLAMTSQYQSDYGLLFAGLAIVTVPLLVVYIVLQRYLVKGVTAGAVKG